MTVRRGIWSVTGVALSIMVTPMLSFAQQTRPNSGGAPHAYQTPPAPAQSDQQQPPPPMQQMPPAEYQPSGYPEMYGAYNTDYPRLEVNAVPPALVRVVISRAQLRRAESGLNNAVQDLRRAFQRVARLHRGRE